MNKELILLGLGGHAKVLIDIVELGNYDIRGYTAPSQQLNPYTNIPYLGDDNVVNQFKETKIELINAMGSVSDMEFRTKLYSYFKSNGFSFFTLIHPNACVSHRAKIGEGAQIMAGAVVQPFATIGENCIINTNAVVEHDSVIGNHSHIAPGVTISGGAQIGSRTHIGTGASVIQDIQIEDNVVVGAGAVVVNDVSGNKTVVGVPAKEVSK